MRQIISSFLTWIRPNKEPFDYDQIIHLDAEELAEAGIPSAYQRILPRLRKLVSNPYDTVEYIEDNPPVCIVERKGERLKIDMSPHLELNVPDVHWLNASLAFFYLVNHQLVGTEWRLYTLYGDNDLSAVFLTEREYQHVVEKTAKKSDHPYLAVNEPPHYGFPE